MEATCSQVDGRVPVLVNITDTSYKASVAMAETAKECGADAVVVAPPFYFRITQRELCDYTRHLLEELPLPALLYNNPSLTKVAFQLEPLRDLLQHPGIAGFKDSSGDLVYFHKLKKMADSRDIPLFVGPEELLMDVLVMGGAGGVPGGANIFPSLYVDLFDSVKTGDISRGRTLHQKIMQCGANIFPSLYVDLFDSVKAGDISRGRTLHQKIMQLSETVYGMTAYGSSDITGGIKAALSLLDVCGSHVSAPLQNVSRERARLIEAFITKQTSDDE